MCLSVRSLVVGAVLLVSAIQLAGPPAHSTQAAGAVVAVTRCYTNQLTAAVVGSSGATGHIAMQIRFHNRSARTCTLFGYPGALLLNARRQPLPTHVQRGDGFISGISHRPHLVRLNPGANAYAVFEWAHIPTPGQRCPTAPSLLVTPPNTYRSLLVSFRRGGVDACGGNLTVTPVQARPYQI